MLEQFARLGACLVLQAALEGLLVASLQQTHLAVFSHLQPIYGRCMAKSLDFGPGPPQIRPLCSSHAPANSASYAGPSPPHAHTTRPPDVEVANSPHPMQSNDIAPTIVRYISNVGAVTVYLYRNDPPPLMTQ